MRATLLLSLAIGCGNPADGTWAGMCFSEDHAQEMDLFMDLDEKAGVISGFGAASWDGDDYQGQVLGSHDMDVVLLDLQAAPVRLLISGYYEDDRIVGTCSDEDLPFDGTVILVR